jgi:hypothetical protein
MARRLELDRESCKQLYNQTRHFLSTKPRDLRLPSAGNPAELEAAKKALKEGLLKTAYLLLKTRNWGHQWFGENLATAGERTLVWPTNSTL